jgi:phasin family protein
MEDAMTESQQSQAKTTTNKTASQAKKKTTSGSADVTVLQPVQEAMQAGREQMESAVKASNDALGKQVEQMMTTMRDQVDQTSETVLTGYQELAGLVRAQADAVVASANTVTDGVENLSREVLGFYKERLDSQVETARKAFAVTSFFELFELQTALARETMDSMMSQTTRLTEMSVKIATDAMKPLQTNMQTTVEKITTLKTAA